MGSPAILVLGLGNDLLSDDGFGPAVARACRTHLAGRDDVVVDVAATAGLNLLDLLSSYRRALIVDVVQTGERVAGSLGEWPIARASAARSLGGSHQVDLQSTLALGRALGWPMPESVTLLVAEAADLETFHEGLTPRVASAVPEAAVRALRWVEEGSLGEQT